MIDDEFNQIRFIYSYLYAVKIYKYILFYFITFNELSPIRYLRLRITILSITYIHFSKIHLIFSYYYIFYDRNYIEIKFKSNSN